jgi:hypothetical protein
MRTKLELERSLNECELGMKFSFESGPPTECFEAEMIYRGIWTPLFKILLILVLLCQNIAGSAQLRLYLLVVICIYSTVKCLLYIHVRLLPIQFRYYLLYIQIILIFNYPDQASTTLF